MQFHLGGFKVLSFIFKCIVILFVFLFSWFALALAITIGVQAGLKMFLDKGGFNVGTRTDKEGTGTDRDSETTGTHKKRSTKTRI